MVISALENKEEIFIRDFSIKHFHDSKRVEQLKAKAETLLFKYGDYEEKDSVLEELGIVATPTYVMLKGNGETAAKTGLALLIGGGASNLIDRVQRGYVTDYFSIDAGKRFQRLRKIVFNCSDFCVFAGVLLYFFGRSKRR